MAELATSHPGVEVRISEYEPLEAVDLLGRDDLDLALIYDYNLAPRALRNDMTATELWSHAVGARRAVAGDGEQPFSAYARPPTGS